MSQTGGRSVGSRRQARRKRGWFVSMVFPFKGSGREGLKLGPQDNTSFSSDEGSDKSRFDEGTACGIGFLGCVPLTSLAAARAARLVDPQPKFQGMGSRQTASLGPRTLAYN